MKYAICEITQFFDEELQRSMCRVYRVIQVFETEEAAEDALVIFDPLRYDDYDTVLRVVGEDKLNETFR